MSLTAAQTELIETWQRTCRQMVEFFEQNQRPPLIDSRDPEERQLALWIVSQVRNYTHRQFFMKSEYFRQIWSELRSTWTSYLTTADEGWQINCDKLVAFLDEHGRRPKERADTDYEKWLYFWMNKQRLNYDDECDLMARENIRRKWDQVTKKYVKILGCRETRWDLNLEELIEFVVREHRGPSVKSNNLDEKRISGWTSSTNAHHRSGELNPDRKRKWERFCLNQGLPITSFPAAWFKMRYEVVDFFTRRRRRPSQKSDSPKEQEMGYWLANQLRDYSYSRGLMTDPEILTSWKEMRRKHPELALSYKELKKRGHKPTRKLKKPTRKLKKQTQKLKKQTQKLKKPTPTPKKPDPVKRDHSASANRIIDWCQTRDELVLFYKTHRRIPKRRKHSTPEEKRLFNWLQAQQVSSNQQRGIFSTDLGRSAWNDLVEKCPEIDLKTENRWVAKFKGLRDFLRSKKRLPSAVASDRTELLLARWYYGQRQNYRRSAGFLSQPKHRARWKAMVDRHSSLFMTKKEKWIEKKRLLVEFFETHQRAPSAYSADREEVRLAEWLYQQYKNFDRKSGMLKSANFRRSWCLLIKRFPLFVRNRSERWFCLRDRLEEFLETHGRRPQVGTGDRAESQLGRWLAKQNHRPDDDREISEAWKKLVERFPILITGHDRWYYNRDLLRDFFNTHGRKPLDSSADQTERRLSAWIDTQKETYKKQICRMRHSEIREAWEQLIEEYPEYICTLEERWLHTLDRVIRFIETHGRRPQCRLEEPGEEKRLGDWLILQTLQYKNNARFMQVDAIRTAWENLLLTYEPQVAYKSPEIKRQLAAIKAR